MGRETGAGMSAGVYEHDPNVAPRVATERPLRVLYVWDDEYPWDVRVEKVCAALTAAGHDVHITARNRRRAPTSERRPEGTVHRLRPWGWLGRRLDAIAAFPAFFNPRWLAHLRRCARQLRPHVIIVRDLPLCPTAIWTARRSGSAIILDMAENYPAMMRTLWDVGRQRPGDVVVRNPALVAAVERYCLPRVDRILVVVEESAQRLQAAGVEMNRIDVVSNTPPVSRARQAPVVTTSAQPTLIYLGLLEIPRGVTELLDAVALLHRKGLRPKLHIIGGGRDSETFREHARELELGSDDVVFFGHVPHERALEYVAQADIGVVPLRAAEAYDTTVPNKLFDYMAAGLGVVTSDTAPSARIVRETGAGEVYRAGDASDLAAAIERLWDARIRQAHGERGRRAILERYNWDRDASVLRRAVARTADAAKVALATVAALVSLGCTGGKSDAAPSRSDVAGQLASDGQLPSADPLFSSYSPKSPHWPHLRTLVADYRIQYQSDPAVRRAEYRWAAAHFDRLILDNGDSLSVPQYRALNAGGQLYRYALNWTVIQPGQEKHEDNSTAYYAHMQRWYEAHPQYRIENAFLHETDRCPENGAIESCRLAVHIWTQDRWCVNPGDPGLRAYQRDRLREVARDVDGVFLDEHGSEDMAERLRPRRILEYRAWERYESDIVELLAAERAALGSGRILLLNTSAYTSPWDLRMAEVAGGSHGELLNDAFRPGIERIWNFAEDVLASGATFTLSPADEIPSGYPAGNSATPRARKALWELASYYMVVPERPDRLFLNLAPKWDQPYETRWPKAVEANVGKPLGPRALLGRAGDSVLGTRRIWRREFERAVVLLRPADAESVQKSYSDALEIDLPAGRSYLPLRADGTLGEPTSRIALRGSEGAILIDARVLGR
jgi:glycosyltransferase involved in cell wall biosynthesis